MIIAFEGLDGSGKSATAPVVAAKLRAHGYSAASASKRATAIQSAFAQEQVQALEARLWGIPHDSRLQSVGSLHWVYLNGAFFAATHHALTEELGSDEIVVMDNWINKFVARIVANGELPFDQVMQIVAAVPEPDVVVLLDVDSSVAVQRKTYSPAEGGGLSRDHLDARTFQERVGKQLKAFAAERGWIVVTPGAGTVQEVATEVAERIVGRLRTGSRSE